LEAERLEIGTTNTMNRIIGRYSGAERGPLLLCFGAIHGNEPAGVLALERLLGMLREEPYKNPGFVFKGRIVGVLGNRRAYEEGVRYIDIDLNRQFGLENLAQIRAGGKVLPSLGSSPLTPDISPEYIELKELLDAVENEIKEYRPDKIVVLDLHTTSAGGGIFSIVGEGMESLYIAAGLHAPVVQGLIRGMGGTTLHYFNTQNIGIPTTAVSFEAGQHDDPLSVDRSIAVIVNCMRTIGCVRQEDVENRHDAILKDYSANLPRLVEIVYRHGLGLDDGFRMLSGYVNFQAVTKGEILAVDNGGDIVSPSDCLILMPLYQTKGSDGFFFG
jgi:predicted deacylase